MYTECTVGSCGNPIFSSGLCRKHYEQERLKNAVSCSIHGCNNTSYRGDLCVTHYREKLKLSRPLCTVPNCKNHQKTLSSGLCEKHLFRLQRHGSITQPRPSDWGSRESHPLYSTYHGFRRKGVHGMSEEWRNDFWLFVNTVGERPSNHTLRRINDKEPISASNWLWKESESSADKAAYARAWRNSNPEKMKNSDLKKKYGIGLNEYNNMCAAQNNVCAICNKPEMSTDKDGGPRMMAVDHCHKTGKVRALLCGACNKALGGFKDDPELLRKAALYIESF